MNGSSLIAALVGPDQPLPKLPKNFPSTICEDSTLGLDLGIGSCGTAIVYRGDSQKPQIQGLEDFGSHISFLGVRAFDVPETKEKTGPKLKNPERRAARLMRRTVRRRASRMRNIRRLLKEEGVLPEDYSIQAKTWQDKHVASQPWQYRVEALERQLADWEWACVLLHFAKHRGFKSNRKSDRDSKGAKDGTLASAKANHEALASSYPTLAKMFSEDARFASRKRNREGSYTSVVLRSDLLEEIYTLFKAQAALGNSHTSETFLQEYIQILETQRPLQNAFELLEFCPFEPTKKRGPKASPSFEFCRLLQKLNTLVLSDFGRQKSFIELYGNHTEAYRKLALSFGLSEKVTYQKIREYFAIPPGVKFQALQLSNAKRAKNETIDDHSSLEKLDIATTGSKGSAYATHLFRKVLGEDLWAQLTAPKSEGEFIQFASIDEAAFALSFYEVFEDHDPSVDTILKQLQKRCEHNPNLIQRISEDYDSDKPKLLGFNGSVATSMECSRNLIPHLAKGLVYSDAMKAAGYSFQHQNLSLKSITNPVVQSVVRETIKQVVNLICEYGKIPGSIQVEIGRDLGKSIEERNEIDRGIKKRTNERNSNRERVAEFLDIPVADVSDEALLKYELSYEQSQTCPYCGCTLPSGKSLFTAVTQIDHILPRSRSHDNSYDNKVLVCSSCNQNKKNRTPFEFFGPEDSADWRAFTSRLESLRGLRKQKRRNLLNLHFAEREDEFLTRNLNDTRYISRIVTAYLHELYRMVGEKPLTEKGSTRRVFVRPGALTALVRKAWGLENLKKDLEGKRLGDKHHAVDALVCACLGDGGQQFVTALSKAYRRMEELHEHPLVPKYLPRPWDDFRHSVIQALNLVNVSRRERRSGRGSLHDDTVYGKRYGQAWKRSSLITLVGTRKQATLTKLEQLEEIRGARLEDVEKNPKNKWFREALSSWIERGSPTTELPTNPNGQPIQKVYKAVSGNSLREINRGWVSNGNMVRCDVFSKKGRYYFVPVYSYQLQFDEPPMKYIQRNKTEEHWDSINDSFSFEFSLWPNSRFVIHDKDSVNATSSKGIIGNYCGVDRSNAALSNTNPNDKNDFRRSSAVTCARFVKEHIDRLGRVFTIQREQRTWRGKVCM